MAVKEREQVVEAGGEEELVLTPVNGATVGARRQTNATLLPNGDVYLGFVEGQERPDTMVYMPQVEKDSEPMMALAALLQQALG